MSKNLTAITSLLLLFLVISIGIVLRVNNVPLYGLESMKQIVVFLISVWGYFLSLF